SPRDVEETDAVVGRERNLRNPVADGDIVGARLAAEAQELPEGDERQHERRGHRRDGNGTRGLARERPDPDEPVDQRSESRQQRNQPDVSHMGEAGWAWQAGGAGSVGRLDGLDITPRPGNWPTQLPDCSNPRMYPATIVAKIRRSTRRLEASTSGADRVGTKRTILVTHWHRGRLLLGADA